MLIEDVNSLCKLFGKSEFVVEDIGSVGSWCLEAKGELEDGSFYQFRVSEELLMFMSLFSNGSGLLDRVIKNVPVWCKEHEIMAIDFSASPTNREFLLAKIPEDVINEFFPSPDRDIAIRNNALDN